MLISECILYDTPAGVGSVSVGGAPRGANVIALKSSTNDHYVDLSRTVRACESPVGAAPSARVGTPMFDKPTNLSKDHCLHLRSSSRVPPRASTA